MQTANCILPLILPSDCILPWVCMSSVQSVRGLWFTMIMTRNRVLKCDITKK